MDTLIFGIIVIIALFGLSLWQTMKNDTTSSDYPVPNNTNSRTQPNPAAAELPTNSSVHEEPNDSTKITNQDFHDARNTHNQLITQSSEKSVATTFEKNPKYTEHPKWYSTDGRINRATYCKYLTGVLVAAILLVSLSIGAQNGSFPQLVCIPVCLYIFCFALCIVPQRVHDLSWSAKWLILIYTLYPLAPFLWIVLCFFPTSQLPNKYGPPAVRREKDLI